MAVSSARTGLRVLVLTPYLYGTAPGPRSSIELWERVLAPEGITFEYASFENERLHALIYEPGRIPEKALELARGYVRQTLAAARIADFDAVLVYREAALIGPALLERWVARRGKPMIYQLDDPLYVPYRSPSNGYFSYLKFFGKVKAICRMSRVVIVNSRQHREFAAAYNGNIHEIPSVVDGDRFLPPERRENGTPVRIGWSGSSSTVPNLRVIGRVLAEVSARPDVELRLIGPTAVELPGVAAVCRPWSAEMEVEELARLDVGLLPLPVDEWTKRKFYLKLVQYMALGIPAVASPLGSNPDVVEEGATGFLAEGDDQWRARLDQLIADPELRSRLGARSAEVAHARYTLQANADRIVAAVRSALA